ncbi:MAG: hypothetical protein PHI85_01780 [Victivallaceae bacterium]|nr:hypothetical protein [Victivallaceae bacterium]
MNKKMGFGVAALLLCAAAGVWAVDKAEELKKLEAERTALTWKIVDKRSELISGNADCRELHEQIMALHRELALKLDADPAMRELNVKAEELDRRIAELKK